MSEQNLIGFEGVSFAYGEEPLLEEVSFEIPRARAVCIVGPNGCGKTTLCQLMTGILKPRSGRIEIMGQAPEQARKRIGYLPQHQDVDMHFPAIVEDVVLMGALGEGHNLFGYSRRHRERARSVLAQLGLAQLEKKSFAALSGGQRRRVLIARALMCEPDLLVMDEPMANVDPAAEHALLETLGQLSERVSVLLVSHQFDFVSRYVEQVICMHDGHVHVHPTAEVTPERLEALYHGKMRLVQHDQDITPHAHG